MCPCDRIYVDPLMLQWHSNRMQMFCFVLFFGCVRWEAGTTFKRDGLMTCLGGKGSLRPRRGGGAHLQVGCLCTALPCTELNLCSPTCCSHRAERRWSVEPGLWEDDEGTPQPGRRQRTPCHARDAERERPMLLRPLRDFLTPGRNSATRRLQGCSSQMGLCQPSLVRSCWD